MPINEGYIVAKIGHIVSIAKKKRDRHLGLDSLHF